MKPKTMILLFVAASCGLVASYMTSKLLAERKAPPPVEQVDVVVATTKVPKFTQLKEPEKFFSVKKLRSEDAPKSYFSSLDDLKDKRLNKDLKAESHISPEDVQDRIGSSLPIPDGYGAIGVRVDPVKAVSYFVSPGDKVDVVWTERGEQSAASTILWDVLVLSVADRIIRADAETGNQGATIQAQTVSVALKSDDIQKVRLAEQHGELSLVLRKDGEKQDSQPEKRTTLEDLRKLARRVASGTPTPVPEEKPADPNKLPFGLKLDEIQKGEKKEDKVPELPLAEKFHEIELVDGDSAPTLVAFYKLPSGRVVRQDHPVLAGFRKSDKPAVAAKQ